MRDRKNRLTRAWGFKGNPVSREEIKKSRITPEIREQRRRENLDKKYGLTPEDVEVIIQQQGGGCRICGYSDRSDYLMFPQIDHCHKTGKIRGVLCAHCNTAIGKFRDDPQLLRKAAEYLEYHEAVKSHILQGI